MSAPQNPEPFFDMSAWTDALADAQAQLASFRDMVANSVGSVAKAMSNFGSAVKDAVVGLAEFRLPTDKKPEPLPRGASDGLFRFYTEVLILENAIDDISIAMRAVGSKIAAGVNEVVAEFKHTAGQLQDFFAPSVEIVSKVFATIQPHITSSLSLMNSAFQATAITVAKFGAMVGDAFGSVSVAAGGAMVASISALASALGAVASNVARFGASLGSSFVNVAKLSGLKFAESLTWLGDKIIAFGGALMGKVASSFQSVAGGGQGGHGAGGIETGSKAIGSIGGVLQSAVAMITTPMATLAGGLIAGGESIGQFVGALNPGLMIQFQRTLQDLYAVVGTALEPVMQAIVPLLQEVGNTLYPIAKQFAEVLKPFLEAAAELTESLVKISGTVMEALLPLIDVLATTLGGLAKIVAAVVDFGRSLIAGLTELMGALYKSIFGINLFDATKGFRELLDEFAVGVRKTLNALLLMAAMVAKFFGADSFIKGLIEANKPKPQGQAVGLAAAQNPSYQSIESLGKQMALQAAIATAGVGKGKKNQDELAADMLKQLEDINNGNGDINKVLAGLPQTLQDLPTAIKDAIVEALKFVGVKGKAAAEEVAGGFVDAVIPINPFGRRRAPRPRPAGNAGMG